MRLQSLDLIRYGRFTGQNLNFPRAECDFHLVVGPNEAGKSTLRRAVAELLFGMPLRSDMGFVHPLAELRLGAVIESPTGSLAFHRARGRKQLRRPDDATLPDNVLAEHLGGTSELLFNRMFGLDLAGLIEGGQSILDASDDVGQLLFQSAAGLSTLGQVRDQLEEEAKGLFAPRKSGERIFYQALERHEQARKTLREATVNVRQWSAAAAQVEALQLARDSAVAQYTALSASRQQLERIRRIAPHVAQWRDAGAQLQALAGAALLPADAAQALSDAEAEIARQTATLNARSEAIRGWQAELDALAPQVDSALLAQADAIDVLAAQGHACQGHAAKLARAQQEVDGLLRDAARAAQQLGWPEAEAALRARVPTALALKALSGLLHERGALLQAQQSAQDAHERAQAVLQRLQSSAVQADGAVPAATLAGALQEALAVKGSAARQRALQLNQSQAESQLQAALDGLGPWRMALPALAALALPADEQLSALKAERAALLTQVDITRQQLTQAQDKARESALAVAQFAQGRSVVTADDVQQARTVRDALWGRIKQEQEALAVAAPQLDQAIVEADRRVDLQRDHAEEAARCLALRQEEARDQASLQAAVQRQAQAVQALADFEAHWSARAQAMGLPGMALLDLGAWLAQRRVALDAAAAAQSRAAELGAEADSESAALAALRAALQASAVPDVAQCSLTQLCALAQQSLDAHQASVAAQQARAEQNTQASLELAHQARALTSSQARLADWQAQWAEALQAASLSGAIARPEVAPGTIEIVSELLQVLAQIDGLRRQQIETLQLELSAFEAGAADMAQRLGRPASEPAGAALTQVPLWGRQLQAVRAAQQAHARLTQQVQAAQLQVQEGQTALAATRAALQSLYQQAGSDDHAIVRARIAQSDRQRALSAEVELHRQRIVADGDGLSLDALLAACDGVAPESLKPEVEALDAQLLAAVDQRSRLSSELTQAQAELDRIHGGADAATAESQRLEALAQMGDAAERYITVATGHRLLRWAIDRYRERKQGPLLQRASALFSQLTLGGFTRLAPDFETQPPRLIAVRASGDRVGIGGLSEGTRDQLFLALRLAALEMHMAADRPLPFIADDLFVNFHDSRSRAGLAALGELARKTQVIFLTHHEHLIDVARESVGPAINVIALEQSA